ncbi:MAG TPA: TIGR01777 family oxidoreductase [Terriglobia bacterium]|nr:TIGR01777 family oxidoreductase [Terriglobia bacterium]
MNILVTGSNGLVGSALIPVLTAEGHRVSRLVRSKSNLGIRDTFWDPAAGELYSPPLEGLDGVVHLAGESIADGRWSKARKARIRESRVQGTRLLSGSLARLVHPPKVLISASAIGYYGDRGQEILSEQAHPGSGFLAGVCQDWEAAVQPAPERSIRVVTLRTGIVLSPVGGALARMLLPFRMGVGGVVGSGKQYMSWITIDDMIRIILYALKIETLRGPVNAVAPKPVTNAEFTRILGRVLSRPTVLPMPGFAARLAFGEIANELLLSSARVVPAKLEASGFVFRHPDLETALSSLLGVAKAA